MFSPRPDQKYAQVVKVKDAHGNLEKVETMTDSPWRPHLCHGIVVDPFRL
jgi:hypothetical protein